MKAKLKEQECGVSAASKPPLRKRKAFTRKKAKGKENLDELEDGVDAEPPLKKKTKEGAVKKGKGKNKTDREESF